MATTIQSQADDLVINAAGGDVIFQKDGVEKFRVGNDGTILTPERPYFYAYANPEIALPNTSQITYLANNTRFNIGNHFNTTDGKFYAPVSGVYQFGITIGLDSPGDAGRFILYLFVNDVEVISHQADVAAVDTGNSFSVAYYLNAGDSVIPKMYQDTGVAYATNGGGSLGGGTYSSWHGYLVG